MAFHARPFINTLARCRIDQEITAMLQLLEHADQVRRQVSPNIDQKRKSELGQFMTPASVANFMASLFTLKTLQSCRLLDAGAGIGSLSCAFIDRFAKGNFDFQSIEVMGYEIDDALRTHLHKTLNAYSDKLNIRPQIFAGDFIEQAVQMCKVGNGGYTHAILNPPYKKINSNSKHRLLLREVGIETVNLYSAFIALALELMINKGQMVAIIPRSFCNGPYYRPFREWIMQRAAIRHIHLFDSRNKAFKDDKVLQENIIIMLERGVKQGDVTVTTSTDDNFSNTQLNHYSFERIVMKDDPEKFIHIPTSTERNAIELSPSIQCSLAEIGIQVSTGPVVDFRLKSHLRGMPESGTVPLLYPGHFKGQATQWPKPDAKKPNAIQRNGETEKWLYPNGFYCIVKRFSSKEEKRRIVAGVVDPSTFKNIDALGFENHLNVFHDNKKGLSEPLARGLALFLSTSSVDENFRRYSGHTQVNATDLKLMKYPSRESLIVVGQWAMSLTTEPSQAIIDAQFENLKA